MNNPLLIFLLLQTMDFATTLGALALGGAEVNPLVRYILANGPTSGLVLSKLIVIAIAGMAFANRRLKGIRAANIVFSAVIVWNISVIFRLASRF
jgi:hypothetical protein